MPFDSTTLHPPPAHTVLPPQPPERGAPQRIRIEIEIIDRRARATPNPDGYRFGTVTLVLVVLGLALALLGCARPMAQPTSWSSYPLGGTTIYNGTDPDGRPWTASSYELGGTTYSQFVGPDGQIRRCQGQTFADCQ